MAHADFVHLRVHSAYSLSEGALKIDEIAALCRANGMPAVALADTGNLFGGLEFSAAMADAGVQPIIGAQLFLARAPAQTQSGFAGDRQARDPRAAGPDSIVLLCQDEAGYRNLVRLVSKAFLETPAGETPQIGLEDLDSANEGLLCLTGGMAGPVGRLLGEGRDDLAEDALKALAQRFPGRCYVEIQRHGLDAERRIEPRLVGLADDLGLPLVATNECFFATADLYEAHDALLCIAGGTTMSQAERRRVTAEHRFKTAAEMRMLFADLPDAADNTLVIARRSAFMVRPRDPILPAFPVPSGEDEASWLAHKARDGLQARLDQPGILPADLAGGERVRRARAYRERLDYELDVIVRMGFAGYFLIVADFIQWAKGEGIPVGPGRGSGAGSVVAWALTITDLDPLRFGLLFERFLNPERVSMPDFDIDFCQDRRDEVIRYVQNRYGHDRVAQIITFGKLQARAVLRDVGRVLELPYGQVDRICKLVPNNPANPVTLGQAIASEPQLQAARDQDPAVARMVDIALKLEGLYRHASTHAAGLVIGDRPLANLVPLYRDPRSDMPVTQFSMKYVEKAGLVKFDFLGLKTLTVLARAVDLLRARDVELALGSLPLDDARTYEMLGRGETTGVFQLESSGMRDVLRKLKPDRFEDIIALVALYRPGPMDNIPRYIACKRGEEAPDYLDPALEGILKETMGVMIYQEQVLQIAQVLAGYSLGRADLLRRAMGKKIKAEMDAQRSDFVQGAVARGVSNARASQIFDHVAKFAGYGFNKSHAAAYALVAYQTAYLKANHPVEFMAASMSLDSGNTDKLNHFRQELARLGIQLLPPDVNRSEADFSVEPVEGGEFAIRYALGAIRNVGAQAMHALVRERRAKRAFRDLFDLAQSLDSKVVNKRQLENLAKAGALDSLNPNRAQTHAAVDRLVRMASLAASEREDGQQSLFGGGDGGRAAAPAAPLQAVEEWPPLDRLRHEFEAIGFYLSAHPLDAYGPSLKRLGVVPSSAVAARISIGGSTRVKLAGVLVGKQERTSARGNRFAFAQFSDPDGVFEVTVFSELLAAARPLLEPGQPILITADLRQDEGGLRMTAQAIQPLDDAVRDAGAGLRVTIASAEPLDGLRRLVDRLAAGRGRICVVVPVADGGEAEIVLPGRYEVAPPLAVAVQGLAGVAVVEEI